MYNIQIKTTTQNILLVGFNNNAFTIQEEIIPYFSEAKFQTIDRLIDQSDWLENKENGMATQAIICDYDYMMQHDLMFLKNLQCNDKLRKLPFILVNKNNLPVNAKELLQNGVDDCYSGKIDWKGMATRIHFLQKYKPFILSKMEGIDDMPLQ